MKGYTVLELAEMKGIHKANIEIMSKERTDIIKVRKEELIKLEEFIIELLDLLLFEKSK